MSEPYIGEICTVGFNFAPQGWAKCDGQLLAINSNQSLFSILGTTYGGDGRTTFGLPRLRGRVPIGAGSGPGLSSRPLGQVSGQPNVGLSTAQIPAHTHTETGTLTVELRGRAGDNGDQSVPGPGNVLGRLTGGAQLLNLYSTSEANLTPIGGVPSINATVQNAGSSSGHENYQSYLAITYIIALAGLYPPRP